MSGFFVIFNFILSKYGKSTYVYKIYCCFLIVLLHFGAFFKDQNFYLINIIWEHLNLGVSYFYVLSGFVMMIAYSKYDKINFKDFFSNRIARIYPLHILSLILVIILNILLNSDFKIPKLALLSHLLLIQSWIPRTALTLNAPAWSISVEMFFYLLFPIIFVYIKKIKLKNIFILIISFNIICQILFNKYFFSDLYNGFRVDGFFLFYNPLLHLNSFLVGILFGTIFVKKTFEPKNYNFLILILTITLIILVFIFKSFFIHNGFFSILFGLIILFISLNTGVLTRIFSNKKLVYLGEISFALYLLQLPIFTICDKFLSLINIENITLRFFISFFILLLASHLVFKYFETTMKNYIKKKLIKI